MVANYQNDVGIIMHRFDAAGRRKLIEASSIILLGVIENPSRKEHAEITNRQGKDGLGVEG